MAEGCSAEFAASGRDLLKTLSGVLGLLTEEEEEGIPAEITELVEERQTARKEKNYARADEIRDLLKEKGFAVEDTAQGPRIVKL